MAGKQRVGRAAEREEGKTGQEVVCRRSPVVIVMLIFQSTLQS